MVVLEVILLSHSGGLLIATLRFLFVIVVYNSMPSSLEYICILYVVTLQLAGNWGLKKTNGSQKSF